MQSLPEASKCHTAAHESAGILLELLPRLMRFVRHHMRGRRSEGLSIPQFRVMVQIRRRPELSLSSISDFLGSSLPTTSRIVSGLVSKRLVQRRTASKDRRQTSLQLTARGQAVIDKAWGGTQSVLAERCSKLTDSELATLAKALDLLARTFPDFCEEVEPAVAGGVPPGRGSFRFAGRAQRPHS